nr:hypothetical protein [Ferrovum sp.]
MAGGVITECSFDALLKVSPIVALIREESNQPFGLLLKKSLVSEQRVRRLLAASSGEDAGKQAGKLIRQIGCRANVLEVARIIIFWGEKQKRKIAMDYFGYNPDEDDERGDE